MVKDYHSEPIPVMRRFAFDAGYLGRRRHIVHGLIEVDVTQALQSIQEYKDKTGESLSFTAFIIYCLGAAISKNPHLHAYRDWRNRLVIFNDININSMIEVEKDGHKIPQPYIFKAVNRRSFFEIHTEMRDVQHSPLATTESKFMSWFLYLPAFLRRFFYQVVMRFPRSFHKMSSPVLVTAVGMFGKGGGWAITMPNFTLTVAVGGIEEKPGIHDGRIQIRKYLNLTISVDHDIVDGAPIARFVSYFRELLESGFGLVTSVEQVELTTIQ